MTEKSHGKKIGGPPLQVLKGFLCVTTQLLRLSSGLEKRGES